MSQLQVAIVINRIYYRSNIAQKMGGNRIIVAAVIAGGQVKAELSGTVNT